jgi:alpha-tubulin suppressor-like RCC1 family protein
LGRNNNGRLGDDTIVNKSSPVQIGALTNWSQVSAGLAHTASIKTDGTVWAWGYNTDGQIGKTDTVLTI